MVAKPREPIRVWGLGAGGVNLVKSPLQMDDSEVVSAQNAEPYRDRGQTGIRKRPALRPINSIAVAAVQGLIPVDLAQGGAGDTLGSSTSGAYGAVYVARHTHPATFAWKVTEDGGATWATTSALTNNIADSDASNHKAFLYQGRAFYPGEDDSVGRILCFDGVTEFEFCRLPFGPSAMTTGGRKTNAIGMAMGQFYFANNNGATGAIYSVDPVTGAAEQIGATFNVTEIVTGIVAYAGRVWICTNGDGTTAAHIYSIRPGVDIAWTTERTTTDLGGGKYHGYNSIAVLDGELFAATLTPLGFPAVVERRTAAGVWSTDLLAVATVALSRFDALTVWGGSLYAMYHMHGAFHLHEIWKRTGVATWVKDLDADAIGSSDMWGFLATPPVLYASCPPLVYTKAATGAFSGTWVTSLNDANITHGMLI